MRNARHGFGDVIVDALRSSGSQEVLAARLRLPRGIERVLVGSGAAVEEVDSETAAQRVRPCPAEQVVVAVPAVQGVPAVLAAELIVARVAVDRVVAGVFPAAPALPRLESPHKTTKAHKRPNVFAIHLRPCALCGVHCL